MTDEGPTDKSAVTDAGAGLAASGAGALASLAAGPGGGIVAASAAGLTGPALLVIRRLAQRAHHRRELSAQRVVERAAEIVGGLTILEERTSHDDERLELLIRVLAAAETTTLDAKIKALARVLADGLAAAPGAAEEALVLAAALRDIDATHAKLLEALGRRPSPPEELRANVGDDTVGWEVDQLRSALGSAATVGVIDALIGVLSSHGLVIAQGGGTYPGRTGPPAWRISELGRRCLVLLHESSPSAG